MTFKRSILAIGLLSLAVPAFAQADPNPPRPNTDDGPGACPDAVSPCPGGGDGPGPDRPRGVAVGIGVGIARSTSSASVGNVTSGSNSSVGNVSATGGAGGAANSNQSQSTSNANNSSVVVEGDQAQRRDPVSTAYAAPLVASSDTCMGSSTAGGQGIGFALSIGTTWTDKNCLRLKNSRELSALGLRDASVQIMCLSKDVREAMIAAGTPCSGFVRRKD